MSGTPIARASFRYGRFEDERIAGPPPGFAIEAFENVDTGRGVHGQNVGVISSVGATDAPMIEAWEALRIFTSWFGPLSFSRISNSPSVPTLAYLPYHPANGAAWRPMLSESLGEGVPHAVSHQWWGQMVGPSTYHDEWLSDGFATFSTGLYLQLSGKPLAYLNYWQLVRTRLLQGDPVPVKNPVPLWTGVSPSTVFQPPRDPGPPRLFAPPPTVFRPPFNDAGPLWLGRRIFLDNIMAHDAVISGKGGYVLHMIRQMMYDPKLGDQPFIGMMHDFVSQYKNRNASTEDFQRVVEKHITPNMDLAGNGTLDWFFSEWLYNTTVPRYEFEYTVTAAEDGKFLLKASLTQSKVTPEFMMPVPIYLDLDGQVVRLGVIDMKGNSTNSALEVLLPKKPSNVVVNYWHDILER